MNEIVNSSLTCALRRPCPGLAPDPLPALPDALNTIFGTASTSFTFAPERHTVISDQQFRLAVFAALYASIQCFTNGEAEASQFSEFEGTSAYEAGCTALTALASPSLAPAVSDRAREAAGLIPPLLASVDRLLAEPPPEASKAGGTILAAQAGGLQSAVALMAALYTAARRGPRAQLDPAMTKSLMACLRRGAAVSVWWLEEGKPQDPGFEPFSPLLSLLESVDVEGIEPGGRGTALDASRSKQLLEVLRTAEALVRLAALLPARLPAGGALPTELLDWCSAVIERLPLTLPQGMATREEHPQAQEAIAGLVESAGKFALRWTGRGLSDFQRMKEGFFVAAINVAGTTAVHLALKQTTDLPERLPTPEPMLRCARRRGFQVCPDWIADSRRVLLRFAGGGKAWPWRCRTLWQP